MYYLTIGKVRSTQYKCVTRGSDIDNRGADPHAGLFVRMVRQAGIKNQCSRESRSVIQKQAKSSGQVAKDQNMINSPRSKTQETERNTCVRTATA